VQLGFVIDHSRCIGCHACTVACKSENGVPLGSFRTWVKYTEEGSFPQVRRSFAVLRCNQCSDAPCVTICPVRALEKRPDGIVDVDPAACIGCKGCMQGCPYDALYINETTGTAEKCHFCAHRTELGLAPSCAVVCPTEAILPGDFDDPESVVSRMKSSGELTARKVEAGTRPNVFYREVSEAGIDPAAASGAGGYLWADRLPGPQLDAEAFEALERRARAKTVYDVDHAPLWGWKVTAYLFAKSLAAGVVLAAGLLLGAAGAADRSLLWAPVVALLFLLVTTGFLIGDLRRPERFLYILTRPNWRSWIARGAWVLMGYGAALLAWVAVAGAGVTLPVPWGGMALYGLAAVLAAATAAYTAWLFGQARGRVLWMKRGFSLHLVVQAILAGTALLLLLAPAVGMLAERRAHLRAGLAGAVVLHLLFLLAEGMLAPSGRRPEFRRAARLTSHGPYARTHWTAGVGVGVVLPLLLLAAPQPSWVWAVAGAAALAGLWVEEDIFVRAGQALPIS
jgi:Fe-S-cluster-containing dehydrogenase component/formate-dependent nitrite reductase membrane component NrfD